MIKPIKVHPVKSESIILWGDDGNKEHTLIKAQNCEVIRAVQNALQLLAIRGEKGMRENAYSEFVKSLKVSDREFVERMLKEFERENNEKT